MPLFVSLFSRIKGYREGCILVRSGSNKVEGSFESHVTILVFFIGGSDKVKGSRKSHSPTLFYFGAYIVFCTLFLNFCPRFKGLGHFFFFITLDS
jgi:hypothetical protein